MHVVSWVSHKAITILKRLFIPFVILVISSIVIYFAAQQFPAWHHAAQAIRYATVAFLQRFYLRILLIALPVLIVCVTWVASPRSVLGIVQRYKYPISAISLFVMVIFVLWKLPQW